MHCSELDFLRPVGVLQSTEENSVERKTRSTSFELMFERLGSQLGVASGTKGEEESIKMDVRTNTWTILQTPTEHFSLRSTESLNPLSCTPGQCLVVNRG